MEQKQHKYSAMKVAEYIIYYCDLQNIKITNLKLQQLLYLLQGYFYQKTRRQLISDDFYAWKIGAVVPSVYEKYCVYAGTQLPLFAIGINLEDNTAQERFLKNLSFDTEDFILINYFLKEFAPIDTFVLIAKVQKTYPWKYNYEIFGEKSIIVFPCIAEYFATNN